MLQHRIVMHMAEYMLGLAGAAGLIELEGMARHK
jgi:hypothetical protein